MDFSESHRSLSPHLTSLWLAIIILCCVGYFKNKNLYNIVFNVWNLVRNCNFLYIFCSFILLVLFLYQICWYLFLRKLIRDFGRCWIDEWGIFISGGCPIKLMWNVIYHTWSWHNWHPIRQMMMLWTLSHQDKAGDVNLEVVGHLQEPFWLDCLMPLIAREEFQVLIPMSHHHTLYLLFLFFFIINRSYADTLIKLHR